MIERLANITAVKLVVGDTNIISFIQKFYSHASHKEKAPSMLRKWQYFAHKITKKAIPNQSCLKAVFLPLGSLRNRAQFKFMGIPRYTGIVALRASDLLVNLE